jgi:MFS family permease
MKDRSQLLNESTVLSRAHYWIVGLCWAGWVFDFYDLILYTFLLIPIGEEFHFTVTETAWVLSLTLLMTGVGGIFFGMLADRIGRKPVLQWTIITYCTGTFFCALTHSFWWLLFWRSVTGLGVGGEWGTGHALISETFPADRRGRFGAIMQSGAPIGVGLATIMGAFFAPHFGWRMTFAVSAIPAAVVVLIRRFLPESDVWESHRALNRPLSYGALIGRLLGHDLRRVTILAFILTVLNMGSYWFTYTWFPKYLRSDRSLSMAQSGWWTLAVVVGELIGYTAYGLFSDVWGRRKSFTLFSIIMAAGLALTALCWSFFYQTPIALLGLMVMTGIGTGTWSNFGPMFSELFPTEIRTTALNTLLNLARATQFVTPLLVGALSATYGFKSGLLLGAVFSLIASAWIWLLPETKGRLITVEH